MNKYKYKSIFPSFLVLLILIVISYIVTDINGGIKLGDAPSLLISSWNGNVYDWFFSGFSKYFFPFDGWSVSFTNFIRPVDNFLIYISYVFFGYKYSYYFCFFYLAAFGCAWLAWRLARDFCCSHRYAGMVAILCVLSPAVICEALSSIAFAYDVICGFFVVLALYGLLKDRLILCFFALLLAVFTKESGLYACCAAFLCLLIRKEKRRQAFWMLLPVVLWGLCRWYAFGSVLGGTYALNGGGAAHIKSFAKGLMTWPSGIYVRHDGRPFALSAPVIVFMLLNAVLWLYLAVSGLSVLCQRFRNALPSKVLHTQFMVLLWLAAGLAYSVLLGLSGRFGGSVLPLFFLYMALDFSGGDVGVATACSWEDRLLRLHQIIRQTRWVYALFCICLVAGYLYNGVAVFAARSPDDPVVIQDRSFRHALQHLPRDGRTVYLINAPVSYSRADAIAGYMGLKVKLVYVTQASACNKVVPAFGDGVKPLADGRISVRLPDCAAFSFTGTDPGKMKLVADIGGVLKGVGSYQFPQASVGDSKAVPDLGRQMLWRPVKISGKVSILTYDWETRQYTLRSMA